MLCRLLMTAARLVENPKRLVFRTSPAKELRFLQMRCMEADPHSQIPSAYQINQPSFHHTIVGVILLNGLRLP